MHLRSVLSRLARGVIRIACKAMPDKLAVVMHENTDLVRILDYADASIYLHVESDVELRVRLHSVAKEPEMLPWIRNSLRPGEVFYDIGANIGAYSLLASAAHAGGIDVFAFEPGATNYAQLCRNIALNKWSSRITPFPIALSEKHGLVTFGYSDLTAGAALHSVGPAVGMGGMPYVQRVMGMPLDELIHDYGLPSPNAIKIDVDGAERGVILGASGTLRAEGLRSVLIELEEDTEDFTEIHERLKDAGFFLKEKHRCVPGATDPQLARFHNFVFERA